MSNINIMATKVPSEAEYLEHSVNIYFKHLSMAAAIEPILKSYGVDIGKGISLQLELMKKKILNEKKDSDYFDLRSEIQLALQNIELGSKDQIAKDICERNTHLMYDDIQYKVGYTAPRMAKEGLLQVTKVGRKKIYALSQVRNLINELESRIEEFESKVDEGSESMRSQKMIPGSLLTTGSLITKTEIKSPRRKWRGY